MDKSSIKVVIHCWLKCSSIHAHQLELVFAARVTLVLAHQSRRGQKLSCVFPGLQAT